LIHGTADRDVPHAESVALAAMLALHDVPHEFVSVEGADHLLVPSDPASDLDAIARAHDKAATFLSRHLGGR
jgi:dipeptidyl aminopeptidase/acylaminoacyl peptidase